MNFNKVSCMMSNMCYKISVIMPIYNAEKTLNNAVQSIIDQSIGFKNIELILIDDNSKDNSKKIIDEYCQKYDNIIPYFSKENHGYPSFGRNIGLKLATSDFLMFIDNDDEYDKDICKKLYETIIEEAADIVCCNKVSVDPIGNVYQKIDYKNGIEKEDKVLITGDNLLFFESITIWNKIFKKEIVEKNNISFPENTIGDDFAFSMEYYLNSSKMIYLKDYHGYYWKISSESLSHAVTKEYMLGFIDVFSNAYTQVKIKNKEQYTIDIFKNHLYDRIGECTYLNLDFKETKEVLQKIRVFENRINFNDKFGVKWADIVNKCILSEHYATATLILKTIKKLRGFTFLRKLNRKINK